jgi:hypothetical protein
MNVTHKTATGTVTLVDKEWRDGGFPQASAGVACITVHDDVTNAVWKFTGELRDAAEVVGRLYVGTREKMAVLSGTHIEIEQPADDLMIGKGEPNEDGEFDEFEFNAAAHPDVVAS